MYAAILVVMCQFQPNVDESGRPLFVANVREVQTAICPCRGSKTGICFCLPKGIVCKCDQSKGSEWFLADNGKPVSKTGGYAQPGRPNETKTVPIVASPAATNSAEHGYAARLDGNVVRWEVDGVRWSSTGAFIEGQRFNGGSRQFVLRGGRMFDPSVKPPADTQAIPPAVKKPCPI